MNPISNHPAQFKIWRHPARIKWVCAGRRFGKTLLGKEYLIEGCSISKSNMLYTAPTYGQAKQIMWEKLKERFREMGWKIDKNEAELRITRVFNQSNIWLKSGNEPDRILGDGYDRWVGDEFGDNPVELWTKAVRPALSDKRGTALIIGTPKGFNHFYEYHNNAKTTPGHASFQFRTIDSPFFQTPEGLAEVEAARADLDEKTFRQEYEASFEAFYGRVCYAFDRIKHNTDYEYKDDLPIYVGQDFNRTPMSSCLFQLIGGKMIQFSELSVNTSSTDEVCTIIKTKYPKAINYGIIMRPDATGKRKTSNASKSDFEIIREHGLSIDVANSNPSRVDRWAACNRALEKGLVSINVRNCPKTVKDLESIIYKEGTCELSLKDPLQGHLFDSFGYNICQQFGIIKVRESIVKKYA